MADAGDRVDDGDRQPGMFEDRTLLDMQLDEAVDVVALRRRDHGRIEPDAAHRVGDGLAVETPGTLGIARRDARR